MTTIAALTVQDVSVHYGGLVALDKVTADVSDQSCLGIIGPNGAGKTTLLNVISGLQRPTGGTVSLNGKNITGMSPSRVARIGIGRTFQMADSFGDFTVWDYVRLGVAATRGTEDNRLPYSTLVENCRTFLEALGLLPYKQRRLSSLPYGARKLVDLCRVVVSDPPLLLLDEPTSGLSRQERADMVDHLTTLRRRIAGPRTTVIVDHDVGFISNVSTRMVALSSGAVIARGAPADVMSDAGVIASYLG